MAIAHQDEQMKSLGENFDALRPYAEHETARRFGSRSFDFDNARGRERHAC